jgi:hypothetical protein
MYTPNQIINVSLSFGTFREGWKISSVLPLYKSGDKQRTSNYRPIVTLCMIDCLKGDV